MPNIQDEKNRIDGEVKMKKDEADRQGAADRDTAANVESDRIRQEAGREAQAAEQEAQKIQNEAQN